MQERKKEMHLAAGCGPEVDAGAEADGEHVLRGPVDEVQVEVVLQGRRVQHLHAGDDHTPVSSRSEIGEFGAREVFAGMGGRADRTLWGVLGTLRGAFLGVGEPAPPAQSSFSAKGEKGAEERSVLKRKRLLERAWQRPGGWSRRARRRPPPSESACVGS